MISTMFRFITFVFGIVLGFVGALLILPLPGKTFFNRMSKLPKNAQDLIDDSISLGISIFRVGFGMAKEFNTRFADVIHNTRDRIEELNEEFQVNQFARNLTAKEEQDQQEEKVEA